MTDAAYIVAVANIRRIALPLDAMEEILPPCKPQRAALAPATVSGMLLWRGQVLPVVSLRNVLGEMEASSRSQPVLVCRGPSGAFGIACDATAGIVSPQEAAAQNIHTLAIAELDPNAERVYAR